MGKDYLRYHTKMNPVKEGMNLKQCELSNEEMLRRKNIVMSTRKMISDVLEIVSQDETSIMTSYRDFFLQVSFSDLHPLMVFCLAKPIEVARDDFASRSNKVNLTSVLGSHCVNEYYGCYHYRATHWLDTEITQTRFFEILDRCVDEASRGYQKVAS